MDRRILIGLGVATLLILAIGGAALIGSSNTQTKEPSQDDQSTNEAADGTQTEEAPHEHEVELLAVIRLSGTPGTSYSGTFGPIGEAHSIEGTLREQYLDYEVEADIEDLEGVYAVFEKPQPGDEGTLRVQLLSDQILDGQLLVEREASAQQEYEVLADNETSEDLGVVEISWSPQGS